MGSVVRLSYSAVMYDGMDEFCSQSSCSVVNYDGMLSTDFHFCLPA